MAFVPRTPFEWRLHTRTLALGPRTLLMGILNVTPDSFSDGGQFSSIKTALDQALRLLDEGADILDLGGESTRPNATSITPVEEQARVIPMLAEILKARPDTIVSMDTFHASTARFAVESGAEIVNDVSGFTWDGQMAKTCAGLGCGVVLMHTRGRPQEWLTQPPLAPTDILPLVIDGLADSLRDAYKVGIAEDQIVLDPGFGFGKLGDENYTLLAHLDRLQQLGRPVLAGISRKGFLARTLTPLHDGAMPAADSKARIRATSAANVAAILAGAHVLRVHDLRPAVEAAAIADAILAGATPQ